MPQAFERSEKEAQSTEDGGCLECSGSPGGLEARKAKKEMQ